MIHPQLPAAASAANAAAIQPASVVVDTAAPASKIVQVQPKTSHLKMGVHGVEQPAFSLGKGNFLAAGNQQSKQTAA